jgi:hypothetical protein
MVDGEEVSRDINSVKTGGMNWFTGIFTNPTVTVNSQPNILGNAHNTTFKLSQPDDCEAFLKTLNYHTKLQEAMKNGGQESAVAKAIDNLAASFPNLDKAERDRKAELISWVGNKFTSSPDVTRAVASANQIAGRKPQEGLALRRVESRYEREMGEKLTQ